MAEDPEQGEGPTRRDYPESMAVVNAVLVVSLLITVVGTELEFGFPILTLAFVLGGALGIWASLTLAWVFWGGVVLLSAVYGIVLGLTAFLITQSGPGASLMTLASFGLTLWAQIRLALAFGEHH